MLIPGSRIARLLLALLLTVAAAPASAGIDRWTPFGPHGASISDVVLDPHSPATLWIASFTVYKSEDGGASFHLSASGLENLYAVHLAIDPGQPDVLYASAWSGSGQSTGIYRSQDGGAHWTLAAGEEGFGATALAVAPGPPGAPGIVFAGTDRLLRSVDGGASFQLVIAADKSLVRTYFEAVTPDPRNPGTVYAATVYQRLKSTDYGATWTGLVEDPDHAPPVEALVVAPADPRTLYETGSDDDGGGTWRSRDGGATWQGPFPFRGYALAVDPVDSNTVYGGGNGGLFVSHDGGDTFLEATQGVPPLNIEVTDSFGVLAIRTDPARPGYALAATAQGLFATADRGRAWQAPPQDGLTGNLIENFRIDPFDPAHWILSSMRTYYASHDGGRTFAIFADRLQRRVRVDTIELDPFVRNRLWALAREPGSNGLYFSQDGGTTWTRRGDAPFGTHLLLPAPRVLLITGAGAFRSADAGHTWRRELLAGNERLLQDWRNPRTIYDAYGSLRSDDVGRTWRIWDTEAEQDDQSDQAVGFDPFQPRTVQLVRGFGLFATRDGGETFQHVGDIPFSGSRFTDGPLELLFDRGHRGVLYLATVRDGILRSRDGGVTWEPLNDGLPPIESNGYAFGLLQDPVRRGRFYTMPTTGGLYQADFTGEPPR